MNPGLNKEYSASSGEKNPEQKLKHLEEELRQTKIAAESATRAKTAFLANMSHEIRTPLNAVIGMASLLQEAKLQEPYAEYSQTIVHASETLLDLISDILDLSKLETRKLELHNETFFPEDIFLETLDLFSRSAAEKEIDLIRFIDPQVPRACFGDAMRIKQVLLNLISNALKFTERGKISAELRLIAKSEETATLQFRIRDTGIGISQEAQTHIFQPFSQADSSVTRPYGGSGLGLAICRELVSLMGGSISLDSKLGEGSEFRFQIALKISSPPPLPVLDISCLRGKSLLAVDDLQVNRLLLSAFCHQWGIELIGVSSPSEAFALLNSGRKFDAVILDYQMPEVDGITFAKQLMQAPPVTDIPRLLLSSIVDLPQPVPENLFSAILHKPLKPSRLKVLLVDLFQNREGKNKSRSSTQKELSHLRILVAEDNQNNRNVLRLMLKKTGAHTRLVENGQLALEEAKKGTFDIMLLDVQMPVLDGLSVVRKLKKNYSGHLIKPHLIALTANVSQRDKQKCLKAGFDQYLAKPVTYKQLYEALLAGARISGAT